MDRADRLLQLPDEVLHRIWAALPVNNDGTGGPREAWRMCCRRLNDHVFKHCTRMMWRPQSSGGDPDCCLDALLHKFAAAGDGSGLQQLQLGGLRLGEYHCRALGDAVVTGKLRRLHTIAIAPKAPFCTPAQVWTLGLLLSHCRNLNHLALANGLASEGSPPTILCSMCEMLGAVPAPAVPFSGLQVLELWQWCFGKWQLEALRDALRHNLTALRDLNLPDWSLDTNGPERLATEALLVDVVGAALASGALKRLNIGIHYSDASVALSAQHEECLAQVLQSHPCTLATLSTLAVITLPRLQQRVLDHNQQLEVLCLTALSGNDATPADFIQASAALGRQTRLAKLTLGWTHDDFDLVAQALANITSLRTLTVCGNGKAPKVDMACLRSMTAALRKMPDLQSVTINGFKGLTSSEAAALLFSLPPTNLKVLRFDPISTRPAAQAQDLHEFGAALERLTSLEQLVLRNLACDTDDRRHIAAAAAVALALRRLPRLELLDMGVDDCDDQGALLRPSGAAKKAASYSIIAAVCLLPSLQDLNLKGCLDGRDRVAARDLLHSSMPSVKVEL